MDGVLARAGEVSPHWEKRHRDDCPVRLAAAGNLRQCDAHYVPLCGWCHRCRCGLILVDELMDVGPSPRWRWKQSCHLFVPPMDDAARPLMKFGGGIGMRPDWFQRSNGGMPHFDLNGSKRAAAIAAGAIPVGRDVVATFSTLWREFEAVRRKRAAANPETHRRRRRR